jgi:hypothetical protein
MSPRKKSKKQIVVSVAGDHAQKLTEVAEQLRSQGMTVDEVQEATGLITGSYDKALSVLKGVRGVQSVEEQPQFQLPPPDSEVQ